MLNPPGSVTFVVKNIKLPDYSSVFTRFEVRTERSGYVMDVGDQGLLLRTDSAGMTVVVKALGDSIGTVTDYVF